MTATLTRRGFVQLLGAGLAACSSRPARDILPYVDQPPEVVPGVPQRFATALVEDGFARGVIVEAHEGRPTKIAGNPEHPASLGATRAIEQAAVLGLYDPKRLAGVTDRGVPVPWSALPLSPRELWVLVEPTTSPQLGALLARLRAAGGRVTRWSPFAPHRALAGHALAFGRPLQAQLDLRDVRVIVALDAELGDHPMGLAYARQIADGRRVVDADSPMNRIYAIETGYTQLGVIADHRFRATPSELVRIAGQLLHGGGEGWVRAIARDLARSGGIVIAGAHLPPIVHALVAAINAGARGVTYTEPIAELDDVAELAAALDRGEVGTLLVLGGNPAITAPQLALDRAHRAIYVGRDANETAARCRFVAAALHPLEEWDAARAWDGTLAPIQPLIEPLVDGRCGIDLLHAALGDPHQAARDRLAAAWPAPVPLAAALARGVVAGAAPAVAAELRAFDMPEVRTAPLELQVRPHPYLYDGRHAANPWLRELPDPIGKLTWDAAAQLSPRTAAALGVATGDVIALGGVELPAILIPGHAEGAVTVFGDAPRAFLLAPGPIDVRVTGEHVALAITQEHWQEEGRPLALSATLAGLDPRDFAAHREAQPTLLGDMPRSGPQWAMSIDLTTCTGCSACVMACAAENNTPVVGKRQVANGRAMHWLRIDRYVDGDGVAVQPMACQHCEKAPCEYVCPVGATTHSPEGLNEMTYNRCIGTRFCSNNCPYKVRRFNWFDFKDRGLRVLGKNPSVTVRDRGVMEKCTYCVQRLRRAEIDARVAGAPIGEVRTACQEVCPTQAIAFGSIADPRSAVSEQRARPHSYAVLHDQGTVPRTRYLARIRNKNPELA